MKQFDPNDFDINDRVGLTAAYMAHVNAGQKIQQGEQGIERVIRWLKLAGVAVAVGAAIGIAAYLVSTGGAPLETTSVQYAQEAL